MTVCDICSANVARRLSLSKVLAKLPAGASEERAFILLLWKELLEKYKTMACTTCASKTVTVVTSFPKVPDFPPGRKQVCEQCQEANRALDNLALYTRSTMLDSDARACNACTLNCTSKYCLNLAKVTQYLAALQIKALPVAKRKA